MLPLGKYRTAAGSTMTVSGPNKLYEMPKDCEPVAWNEIVIELEKGPDSLGRYSFTMFWLADQRSDDIRAPKSTRDDGLTVQGQCFFARPEDHLGHKGAMKRSRIVDRTNTWKEKP